MNVLVVEDERNLADAIVEILHGAGYDAEAFYDGPSGLEAAKTNRFGVLVLDVMLPGINGFDIVRELRREKNAVPILMLTARSSVDDKVEGLDAGADDYLTKPFETPEFLARIRALARRQGEAPSDVLLFGDLTLDLATHDLACSERSVHLSQKEFEVMRLLMTEPSRPIAKQDLLGAIWGTDEPASENTAEAYVSFLRKKLKHLRSDVAITTLRMLGYRLEMMGTVSRKPAEPYLLG